MLNINNVPWEKLQAEDIKQQILNTETLENFFFELKEDEETPVKLMKEISAFANTFGGYIIIGVSDDKDIKGCKKWTENRIHTTIHDSMSPVPVFDVKSFSIDNKAILIIRIEEGTQPPYIVKDGRIYERVSSGSFPINDSAKLAELYRKQRQYYADVARTIELEPIDVHTQWFPQNLCGCIDVGVRVKCRDSLHIYDTLQNDKTRKSISAKLKEYGCDYSLSLVGTRILMTLARQTASDNHNNTVAMTGGAQNFLEVLNDGSFRYRILLTLDKDGVKSNITGIDLFTKVYSTVYQELVGDGFSDSFIYCEKCERLTVFRQFSPYYYLNDENPKNIIHAINELTVNHNRFLGGNNIVIGNRYPTVGYLHYDHELLDLYGVKWESKAIINQLFDTMYSNLGFVERAEW